MTPSADQTRASGVNKRLDCVNLATIHDEAVTGDQLADGHPVLEVTDAFFERRSKFHADSPGDSQAA